MVIYNSKKSGIYIYYNIRQVKIVLKFILLQ